MLAVVFGCRRFHLHIYGKEDHEEDLSAKPPCLQWMLIEIEGYDLPTSHCHGKEVQLTDGLLWLPNKNDCDPVNIMWEYSLYNPVETRRVERIIRKWSWDIYYLARQVYTSTTQVILIVHEWSVRGGFIGVNEVVYWLPKHEEGYSE